MNITEEQFIKEFNTCYPHSKLRFVKYLIDHFRHIDVCDGLKAAKELTDTCWYENKGKFLYKIINGSEGDCNYIVNIKYLNQKQLQLDINISKDIKEYQIDELMAYIENKITDFKVN